MLTGLAVAFVVMAGRAEAQQPECMSQLNVSYVAGPAFGVDGDVYRVRIALGTGSIVGGPANILCISTVRFFLDCTSSGLPGCTDDGDVIEYAGNLTTTCGTGDPSFWTAHVTVPNAVDFEAAEEVMIPANRPSPPGFCTVDFDVVITGSSDARDDSTRNRVEEVVRLAVADCDNGLPASGSQSGAINLCPVCLDGNECTFDTCSQSIGQCLFDPGSMDGQPCLGAPDLPADCAHPGCLGGTCASDVLPDDASPGCGPTPLKLSIPRPSRDGGPEAAPPPDESPQLTSPPRRLAEAPSR